MSDLTDKMNAAIANLKSQQTGLTADQVQALINPLKSSIDSITASEKDDASKVADLTAAMTEFTTAFATAAPASPAPTSAPANPTPAPTPAPATPAPTAA